MPKQSKVLNIYTLSFQRMLTSVLPVSYYNLEKNLLCKKSRLYIIMYMSKKLGIPIS